MRVYDKKKEMDEILQDIFWNDSKGYIYNGDIYEISKVPSGIIKGSYKNSRMDETNSYADLKNQYAESMTYLFKTGETYFAPSQMEYNKKKIDVGAEKRKLSNPY